MKSTVIYISLAITLLSTAFAAPVGKSPLEEAPVDDRVDITADHIYVPGAGVFIDRNGVEVDDNADNTDDQGNVNGQDNANDQVQGMNKRSSGDLEKSLKGVSATPDGVDVDAVGLHLGPDDADSIAGANSDEPDTSGSDEPGPSGSDELGTSSGDDDLGFSDSNGATSGDDVVSDVTSNLQKRSKKDPQQQHGAAPPMTEEDLDDLLTKRSGKAPQDQQGTMTEEELDDLLTKRSEEEEGEGDDETQQQDRPGAIPPNLTAEQLDDFLTKRGAI